MPLEQQKIVVLGFGTAGIDITNLLAQLMQEKGVPEQEVRNRFYALDLHGLVTENGKDVRPEQLPYARKEKEVQGWRQTNRDISLLDVIRHVKPTVLIGVSGQAGASPKMPCARWPRIQVDPSFSRCRTPRHAVAIPQDLLDWTEGRALIGTGSPFEAVNFGGRKVRIDQTNNSYIFPGLALGISASKAKRVTDMIFMAAAKELARVVLTQKDKAQAFCLHFRIRAGSVA